MAITVDLHDTGRWLVAFAVLAGILGLWGGQAVAAYRLAVARGAAPRGGLRLVALVVLGIISVTGFWLVAGATASPSATLQRYLSAWQDDQPEAAAGLFADGRDAAAVAAAWDAAAAFLGPRMTELRAALGPESRLDPADPFESLRFDYVGGAPASEGREATVEILVVRQVPVRTTFLGIFPATSQETQVVERAGTITLVSVPASALLPNDPSAAAWRIAAVRVGADPP